ncbi:uncharacterized protein si:ch73-303b9.1 [Tachysurus fulvidraco]|uniref:uncharacterized protein si:ch73-303b9.1 n=1 Tax=Tachysurus fulvidraco TaxID=1234273 RepID=UPI000F505C83|nr:uncharacterized protein si:ch73-303b9.1 [Tachysurus fulvidraco]XP_027010611.1 uncharacterized protein si:ch73-303b9.1 [Tachysurus fulvidraco]XP_047659845.1 uncharacterized protein si:ch73-303b9.1 [Tachysurus fulvidraco]
MMEGNCGRFEVAKKCESVCITELDQGFLTDCSLSEGTLKALQSIVVEYTEPPSHLPASCKHSSTVLSPSNPHCKLSLMSPTVPMHAAGMNSLLEGKSSTPYERMTFQKPVLPRALDLSSIDLTISHPLWEVSHIRPNMESPKLCLDSSKVEFVWSPSYQATPPTLAEISSLIWSGTPPEGQRSRHEFTFQDSNLRHAVLELTDEQQKSLSRNMAM